MLSCPLLEIFYTNDGSRVHSDGQFEGVFLKMFQLIKLYNKYVVRLQPIFHF